MQAAPQDTAPLFKTPLYHLHVAAGAKMVPFAGYDMPIQYEAGILKEHLHVRRQAGLFDVSHMGQALLHSADSDPALTLEKLVPGNIKGLKPGSMRYTVLLNNDGGIVDDLMVTRLDEHTLYLVVNAACKDTDYALIETLPDITLKRLEDRALVALQGPKAVSVLAAHIPTAADLGFMKMAAVDDLYVSRSGYTGEDGFEISIPAEKAEDFVTSLLDHEEVRPIGLGARDSLRLEAGLCLYGQDIDETTNPVEANLKWVIGKRRREAKDFPAAQKIMQQYTDGAPRLRIGLQPDGKAPIRAGTELFSTDGGKIGHVTSGGFGPSVNSPVAMGYVDAAYSEQGTKIHARLRGKMQPCTVVDLPFIVPGNRKG